MKLRKPSNRVSRLTRLTLFLSLIFCIGILTVLTGITYARYRTEHQDKIAVQVAYPETILLGTVEEGVFTSSDELKWVAEGDVSSLQFAVANGDSETSYSTRDQAISLCMVGSLGILKNEVPPEVSVTFVSQENGEEQTVEATVSSIAEGTALYRSYGAGWLYTFHETTAEGDKELTWELLGGSLSYIILTVKTDEGVSGLLQPLISAELISN